MDSIKTHQGLPSRSPVRQIDSLQVLRAVAVVLVAWAHLCQSLTPISRVGLPNFGIFGIDIFFVISGFIMSTIALNASTKPGIATAWLFLNRRLIRIFPIYWLYAALSAIRIHHSRHALPPYLKSLLLLPVPQWDRMIDLSWTLMFEMFFYGLLSLVLLATVRAAVPCMMLVLCILVGIGLAMNPHMSLWTVVCNPILLEFVFGAGIALAFRRFGVHKPVGMALICIGIAASLYLCFHPSSHAESMQQILSDMPSVMWRVGTWGLAAACLVGGGIFAQTTVKTWFGKLTVVIGNSSYSAYLASVLVIEFSLRLLLNLVHVRPLTTAAETSIQLAALAAVLAAGWLSYQFVEWPLVRRLQAKLSPASP